MSRTRAGFTLIELMLAVAVAIIILMIAIPSVSGLMEERRLRESFDRFDAFARKAQVKAVSEQRSWVLIWEPGRVLLEPAEPTPEERLAGEGVTDKLDFAEGETYAVVRPTALLPAAVVPGEWTFWRSGTCEPVVINYEGPDGWWTAEYNPLTGYGDITDQGGPK